MIRNTISVTILLLLALSGCKVVLVTPSGGSIQSASGIYDCPARERCEIEIEAGSTFTDTFTAEAVDGKRFVRWEKGDSLLCGASSEPCELTLSPDLTAWPVDIYLVPIFENDTGDDVELQNRISRIENGLEPHLQVIGQPVPTFKAIRNLIE